MAARKSPEKSFDRQHGKWHEARWSDGTEQWSIYDEDSKAVLYIERVVRSNSRRKLWCIVTRAGDYMGMLPKTRQFNTSLYPPKVAGPFPSLAGAKTTLLLLLSTGEYP